MNAYKVFPTPWKGLPLMMKIEADRMTNLVLDDEIIEHYNDPTVCGTLSEQARMDLDKLRGTLGVQTPMRWARCRGATGRPMLRYSRSLPSDEDTSADAALAWEKERLSIT